MHAWLTMWSHKLKGFNTQTLEFSSPKLSLWPVAVHYMNCQITDTFRRSISDLILWWLSLLDTSATNYPFWFQPRVIIIKTAVISISALSWFLPVEVAGCVITRSWCRNIVGQKSSHVSVNLCVLCTFVVHLQELYGLHIQSSCS